MKIVSIERKSYIFKAVQSIPKGYAEGLKKSCTEYYRFGFNGKENDKEWGNQLIQDYGFRLYNPAIAKFLSVDPLAPEYPMLTPYQFASNTPIRAIDRDGLEGDVKFMRQEANRVAPKLGVTSDEYLDIHRGNSLYNIYQGAKYTAQGAATHISMGVSAFGSGGLFLTGGTGSYQYYNFWGSKWVRLGSYESDNVQQQVAWLAVEEGAFAALGGMAGIVFKSVMKASNVANVPRMIGGYNDLMDLADDGFRAGGKGIIAGTKSIDDVVINSKGIENIKQHLSQDIFTEGTGKINAGNQVMIDRLEKINKGEMKATDTDKYFYSHETREQSLMNGNYSPESYYKSHSQAAKEYGVKAQAEESTFYTKEAIQKMWE